MIFGGSFGDKKTYIYKVIQDKLFDSGI